MLITIAYRPRLPARGLSSHPLSHLITTNTLKEDLVLAKLKMRAREVVIYSVTWHELVPPSSEPPLP